MKYLHCLINCFNFDDYVKYYKPYCHGNPTFFTILVLPDLFLNNY